MSDNVDQTNRVAERRSEARTSPEQYHSAEFRLKTSSCLFQSKIWNVSARGMCLLVKEDSEVLENLEVGKVLEVTYYPQDLSQPTETRMTRIAHITRESQGRFKNHALIGLLITGEKNGS
jgi:hypothetical protein